MSGYAIPDRSRLPPSTKLVVYAGIRVMTREQADEFDHLKSLPATAVGLRGDVLTVPVCRVIGGTPEDLKAALAYLLDTHMPSSVSAVPATEEPHGQAA